MLALKDRLKYYRNYDGATRKQAIKDESQEPAEKKKAFSKQYTPKVPSVDSSYSFDSFDIGGKKAR